MATNKSDPAAQQYAKALYSIGIEKECLGVLFDELNALTNVYRNDKTFRSFFTSPKVPAEAKLDVVFKSLGNPSEATRGFITQLVKKGRELLLDNIMDAFAKYRDEAENKAHVFVESAIPLDAETRTQIIDSLTKSTKKKIILEEIVRPELIGGLRIRIGDSLIDNSLMTRLEGLKARLGELDRMPLQSASLADAEELYARMKTSLAS